MPPTQRRKNRKGDRRASRAAGNLRIGSHWNAITMIARSQTHPLKAVCELVENAAHRDCVASRPSAAKHRRYLGKLYAKETVLLNFPHDPAASAMDRLIEVLVRTEDEL